MSINLDRYLQRHAAHEKVLYQELSVNDIIRAACTSSTPRTASAR